MPSDACRQQLSSVMAPATASVQPTTCTMSSVAPMGLTNIATPSTSSATPMRITVAFVRLKSLSNTSMVASNDRLCHWRCTRAGTR